MPLPSLLMSGDVLTSLSDSILCVRNYFIADHTVKGWDTVPTPDREGPLQMFWGAPSMHAYLVHRLLLKRGACKFKRTKSFASVIHFFLLGVESFVKKWAKKKNTIYIQHDLKGVGSKEFSDIVYVFFLNIKEYSCCKKRKESIEWYKYENESSGSHQ